MFKKSILGIIGLSMVLFATESFGQMKKLRTVKFDVIRDGDLEKMKYDVDQVSTNSETAGKCITYGWKGVVYAKIAASEGDIKHQLDSNNEACVVAAENMVKYFSFNKDEQEEMDTRTYVLENLPNTIILTYNKGVNTMYEKGKYDETKKYFQYVVDLYDFDENQTAKNVGVSKENAIYNIWASAFTNEKVDEEIIYLEKLMSFPMYYNSTIYTRMSEIYTEKKDYDKAMQYLEKGIAKIPQKSSEFLKQQINIELSRGNQLAVLEKFNKAIEENPDNSNYYFSRGVTYHQLKINDLNDNLDAQKDGKRYVMKYYFSQALADYQKALELNPSNFGALNNVSILFFDSANYIYKERMKLSPSSPEYDKLNTQSMELYKLCLEKFELLRQSGFLKGEDMINLLKDMKSCAAKLQDRELIKKYDKMIKDEKAKS
jgi:tetratricopeptide (TPR) repeat protein